MRERPFTILCSAVLASVLLLSAPTFAQQKTAKQCNDEWTANKAAIQASGKKKKDFIAECRGITEPTATAATPQPPPATTAPGATAPSTATKPAAPARGAGAGQFVSEAQAKAHCPNDTVVWANLDSKIYHFSGNRNYGNTKKGAYMCEGETAASGFRAAKSEKHP
jgi:hypothetical protein